jgi:hypothetical protein
MRLSAVYLGGRRLTQLFETLGCSNATRNVHSSAAQAIGLSVKRDMQFHVGVGSLVTIRKTAECNEAGA